MSDPEEYKGWLEDVAESALMALLRNRGHVITEIEHPDRERLGRPQVQGAKTIDLKFLEDGVQVCVDFIPLSESGQHTHQRAVMERVASRLEAELGPAVAELNPHKVALFWRVGWPPVDAVVDREVEGVKPMILKAASPLPVGASVEVEPRPSFVSSLELTCMGSDKPGFTVSGSPDEQTPYLDGVAEGMAEHLLQSSKVAQLKDCADARVVAIDRSIMKSEDLLAAALEARRARIPDNWTTIYFVFDATEGLPASEVWKRGP